MIGEGAAAQFSIHVNVMPGKYQFIGIIASLQHRTKQKQELSGLCFYSSLS
jgi:hypothetical protein